MIWFTGDTHYGHTNIIKPDYADRPYKHVDEMDEALIANHNAVVGKNDVVYHVGDVSFHRDPVRTANILRRLNGELNIVWGNHDKTMRKRYPDLVGMFKKTGDLYEIKVPDPDAYHGEQRIVLCHYAMRVWNKSHYGAWQVYGHSHGSLKDDPNALSMDVGVDANDYRPISYEEVKAHMARKNWKPVDHHRKR